MVGGCWWDMELGIVYKVIRCIRWSFTFHACMHTWKESLRLACMHSYIWRSNKLMGCMGCMYLVDDDENILSGLG